MNFNCAQSFVCVMRLVALTFISMFSENTDMKNDFAQLILYNVTWLTIKHKYTQTHRNTSSQTHTTFPSSAHFITLTIFLTWNYNVV